MTRSGLGLILSLCLAMAAAPLAVADTLTVGTTGDYRPVSWFNQQTQDFEGTDISLIRAYARDRGHTLQFVPTSWPTLMLDLQEKHFMLAVGGISKTEDRMKLALVSNAVAITGKVALVRCGEETMYQSLATIDQPHVRIVENPGGTNQRFARATLKQARVRILADNFAPFEWLREGKADLMFTDSLEAVYMQDLKNGLCAVNPDTPYTRAEKIVLFRRDLQHLRDDFNTWLGTRPATE